MSFIHTSGVRAGQLLTACAAAAVFLSTFSTPVFAQSADHDDDHDHGALHFSHPLVTESPSPDTKVRFDALFETGPLDARATGFRGEIEYGFSNSYSLAVVAPFVRITSPASARASSLGSVELSAKAASYAFAESGVLVGGGLTVGLPTGNDAKGIGSDHLYEISPFVDAALKRGDVEAVGFLTFSTDVNRNATDENERSVTFDGSLLWRLVPQVELLGEVTTSRNYGSSEGSYTETFVAPGIKYRPAAWPKLAVGVAALRGVGSVSGTNAVQLSAFYHF